MVIAFIIVSVVFVVHMLYRLFGQLSKGSNYNQNISFQGGRTVGADEGGKTIPILQNNYEAMDTMVRDMAVPGMPGTPVTSSFSGLYIRMSNLNTGQYFDLYLEKQLDMGREGGNAFLQFSDTLISNKHCLIYRKGDQIFLQDLGSTNHTYLNGCILETPMPICPGDCITIGRTNLQFQCVLGGQ